MELDNNPSTTPTPTHAWGVFPLPNLSYPADTHPILHMGPISTPPIFPDNYLRTPPPPLPHNCPVTSIGQHNSATEPPQSLTHSNSHCQTDQPAHDPFDRTPSYSLGSKNCHTIYPPLYP